MSDLNKVNLQWEGSSYGWLILGLEPFLWQAHHHCQIRLTRTQKVLAKCRIL